MNLLSWHSIQQKFNGGVLVLGNGASIALWENFNYSSLIEMAKLENFLDPVTDGLFDLFNTNNVEKILENLYVTMQTNKLLGLDHDTPYDKYIKLRDGLLKTLQMVHPKYNDVELYLDDIKIFLNDFQFIVNLNYDLLLYWAIMKMPDNERPKDFFGSDGLIDIDLTSSNESKKRVLYPHGSLCICKSLTTTKIIQNNQQVHQFREFKLKCNNTNIYNENATILDILKETESIIPVLVMEGRQQEKLDSIKNSEYLRVSDNQLRKVKDSVSKKVMTIFGCGFNKNDEHIFNALSNRSAYDEVAVSVYGDDTDAQKKNVIELLIKSRIVSVPENIYFFDANSCSWPQRKTLK